MSLLYYLHNLFARFLQLHSCASTLTTYVFRYLVRGLHVCLVLRPSCLSICPIPPLTLSRFTKQLLGMLLKDSCLKDTLLAMLLKDIHDNSTKQQYLLYSINILKILSLWHGGKTSFIKKKNELYHVRYDDTDEEDMTIGETS